DRHDGLRDLLTQALAGVVDELAQYRRRYLLGRVLLVAHGEADAAVGALDDLVRRALGLLLDLVPGAADEALDLEERALRVEDGLALGHLTDQALVLLEGHDRWRRAVALRVDEDGGLAAL